MIKLQGEFMRSITIRGVLLKLDRRCNGSTQAQVAADIGVQASFLSAVRAGKKPPGRKILEALGLERVVLYRPIK